MQVLIFKSNEKCNSNCIYCDVVARKAPKEMSLELLELCYNRINEFLTEFPEEEMELTWHGGEPLLHKPDYFRKAKEFQDTICKITKNRLKYSMQTNLTLLTQEHIDVLADLGIHSFGTSYEPIPGLRGIGKNRDSVTYNQLFFKGISLLQKHNLRWGYIYVVTKKALGREKELFYHLTNISASVDFHPVLIYNDDKEGLSVTPEEFGHFLGNIFTLWWPVKNRYQGVEPFSSYLQVFYNHVINLTCNDSGACAYNWTYIGPDGSTSHCGRSGDWDMVSYGNIRERTLKEIIHDKQRKTIQDRRTVLPQNDCRGCNLWGICHGGCPLDALHNYGTYLKKTNWCVSKKIFFNEYFEPVTGLKPDFYYEEIS